MTLQSEALEKGLFQYDCEKKLPYSGENFSFGAYLDDRYSIALSTVCGKIPVANIDPYNSSNMIATTLQSMALEKGISQDNVTKTKTLFIMTKTFFCTY
jgi:hypothetical protein